MRDLRIQRHQAYDRTLDHRRPDLRFVITNERRGRAWIERYRMDCAGSFQRFLHGVRRLFLSGNGGNKQAQTSGQMRAHFSHTPKRGKDVLSLPDKAICRASRR